MFKITRGAITITCETSEGLHDAVDALRRGVGERPTVAEVVARSLGGIPDKNPWTPRVFSDFVQAIGSSQTTVLAWLVQHTRATDATLRQAVGVASNKQLAGILSGLSKQAAACPPVSARGVHHRERIESGRDDQDLCDRETFSGHGHGQ